MSWQLFPRQLREHGQNPDARFEPNLREPAAVAGEESEVDEDGLITGGDDGGDDGAQDTSKSSILEWTDDDEGEKATDFVDLESDDPGADDAEDSASTGGAGDKRKAAPGGASASESAEEQPAQKRVKKVVAKPLRKRKALPKEDGYGTFFVLFLSSPILFFLNLPLLFGFSW